jgi:uracil phosphoribosyltransferase
VIILDPMLTIGGNRCNWLIKRKKSKKIKFLCIISTPEGLKK